MQISFVVHVSCFLCLGRNLRSEDQQNQHIIDFPPYEIPDPRSKDQQIFRLLHFILKGRFLNTFPPQFSLTWKSVQLQKWKLWKSVSNMTHNLSCNGRPQKIAQI